MSFQPSVKTYISRGVQTGDDIPSSRLLSLCETQPLTESSNLVAVEEPGEALRGPTGSSDSIRSRLLGTLAYESAYIHPKTSEPSELLPLLYSKTKKYPFSGMTRRANPIGGQQRLSSLPNPPPPRDETLTDRNTRVVSLPECLISSSTALYPGSSSLDDEQNFCLESPRQQQWQFEHSSDRDCFYDAPQTPSPPSSPDSVEIIGNEPQISGSFLRRPSPDDDTWVTWASSPPRPIPALHGPLSLPYARCPSGAEGTVIEGDDLSHKIWGLGATGDQHMQNTTTRVWRNDTHYGFLAASSGDEFSVQPVKSIGGPNLDFQYPISQHQPRARVIDISRPSTFYTSTSLEGNIPNLANDRFGEVSLPSLLLSSGSTSKPQIMSSSNGLKIRQRSRVQSLESSIWLPSTHDIINDSSTIHSDGKLLQVGVPCPRSDIASRTFGTNGQNRLNKSAPVFVPTLDWQVKRDSFEQHSRDGSHSENRIPRRMELLQQRHNDIISPPTSCSPSWSPIFPHLIDIQALTTPRHIQDSPMFPDPRIYSPVLDDDDYSTRLMSMVQQLRGQEHLNTSKRYTTRAVNQPADLLVSERKGSSGVGHELNPAINDNQSTQTCSVDYRPNLSKQNPRSIPLAKLIQRRLSSVPEEIGAGTLVAQPEKHPTKWTSGVSRELSDNTILQREIIPTPLNPQIDGAMQPVETVEERLDHGQSNAVVRLPRKTTDPGRPSSRPADNKRANKCDGKGVRRNDANSEVNSAGITMKDDDRKMNKIPAKEGSGKV